MYITSTNFPELKEVVHISKQDDISYYTLILEKVKLARDLYFKCLFYNYNECCETEGFDIYGHIILS